MATQRTIAKSAAEQGGVPIKTDVRITAPNFGVAQFELHGVAPFIQLRVSEKVKNQRLADMSSTLKPGTRKKREPRDYDQEFISAMYVSTEGWHGLPASALRKAAISACRLVGFKMTLAKLSIFVEADGRDEQDATPLIRIYGDPEKHVSDVRNDDGSFDLRIRAMWREWTIKPRIRWDRDQFSEQDIANLVMRVGLQVGLGEGRPDSKNSAGIDMGMFELATAKRALKQTA